MRNSNIVTAKFHFDVAMISLYPYHLYFAVEVMGFLSAISSFFSFHMNFLIHKSTIYWKIYAMRSSWK